MNLCASTSSGSGSERCFHSGQAAPVVGVFERHELSESLQPFSVPEMKILEFPTSRTFAAAGKTPWRRLSRIRHLNGMSAAKIDQVFREFRSIVQNCFSYPSFFHDHLQAKKKGVSAHARQALVRGVSVAWRSEGEDLP